MKLIFLLILSLFLFPSCNNTSSLKLEKINFLENDWEVVFVWSNQEKSAAIACVTEFFSQGRMHTYYAVVKRMPDSEYLIYVIDDNNDESSIVKRGHIYITQYPISEWGWFKKVNMKDDYAILGWEESKKICDSIAKVYSAECLELKHGFSILKNGNLLKEYNYGNILTGDTLTDFDKLEHKLYRLEGKKLITVSDDPNDFQSVKENGLYFVPPPGYGVKARYRIQNIMDSLKEISSVENAPSSISIIGESLIK